MESKDVIEMRKLREIRREIDDAGLYTKENTDMIVSRGIGNSILPFRVNNRPEIILVELSNTI